MSPQQRWAGHQTVHTHTMQKEGAGGGGGVHYQGRPLLGRHPQTATTGQYASYWNAFLSTAALSYDAGNTHLLIMR